MTEQTEETEDTAIQESRNSEVESTNPESGTSDDSANGESANSDDPESFPREYVVKLRDEAAGYRTRAQRADDLAARLHTSIVAATGRLADPSDLTFEESHLDDEEALTAAIDDLLTRKPHLASRRPVGDVGQGVTGKDTAVDLAGMLRRNAR
jgi:hypothetical protein